MKVKIFFTSIALGMIIAGGIHAPSLAAASNGEVFSNANIISINHHKHHKHHKHGNHWKAYYCPKQPHAKACLKYCQKHGCH
jgi:hypothetical protein